ncbi:MAG: hypothetical protein FJ146_14845 [Deltaproteobacteria bacterium]|nr:hypothetical protein [Deltaproteobacteria bacterium]
MTTADQTGQPVLTAERTLGAGSDYADEIDLIDIIGFMWRWRKTIVSCTLTGLALGGGIWAVKHRPVGAPDAVAGQWTAVVSPATEGFQTALIATNLTAFLKTEAGAQALFENPSIIGATLNEGQQKRLASQQQSGSGALRGIEVKGTQLLISLDCSAGCEAAALEKSVPIALNRAIAAFNLKYAEPYEKAQEEVALRQLELGSIKTQALKLYNKHSGLGRDYSEFVITGLGAALATDKTGDVVTFLLGPVPATEPLRIKLINQQSEAQVAYAAAQEQLKLVKTGSGVETLTRLPLLSTGSELKQASALPLPVSGKGLNNVFVAVVLGTILGGMAGIFVAAIRAFFRSNAARLRSVLAGAGTN